MKAAVLLLVVLGFGWRVCIAMLTPLPSEDGVNYLWMAERFAEGQSAAALGEVFPPLTALLMALPIALGVDPFHAGQLVLVVAGALGVVFLMRAAEHMVPGGGVLAGWLTVFAPLPVRYAAEVYSEPLFLLLAAAAIDRGVRERWIGLGVLSGLAFWVRPEAVVLVAAFAVAAPRSALRAGVPFASCVAALALWRGWLGHGFDPLPKASFNWERTLGAAPEVGTALQGFGEHALRIPWLWVEAFGLLGLLAIWGLLRGTLRSRAALTWALVGGVLLVCIFLPRRRFLVSWLVAASPFAVAGLRALPSKWRRPVLILAVISSLALSLRVMDANRAAERSVGEFLAEQRAAGERVSGDMTRVIYYAGLRPLAPQRFAAGELIAAAQSPAVHFVVLGARRATTAEVVAALTGTFTALALPPDLASAAADRGILVLERR